MRDLGRCGGDDGVGLLWLLLFGCRSPMTRVVARVGPRASIKTCIYVPEHLRLHTRMILPSFRKRAKQEDL